MFDKSKKVEWWTECGVCNKRFTVIAPGNCTNKQINDIFVREHGVHLFPTRCKDHYVQETSDGE